MLPLALNSANKEGIAVRFYHLEHHLYYSSARNFDLYEGIEILGVHLDCFRE